MTTAHSEERCGGSAIRPCDCPKTDLDLRRCELLFALQERTALKRAYDAEQRYGHYNRLAREALEEAARHFNDAFDAAARRHQLREG